MSPRRHQPFQSKLTLEALEDRVIPSTSVFGEPVPADLGVGPLIVVPVAADAAPSGLSAQVLGSQSTLGLAVPVPQFLRPAGTTTVTTSLTGPLTITNFEIDNDQLSQLTGNLQPPDPAAISFLSPTVPDSLQSESGTGVFTMVIPPLRFEWLGLRIESSLVLVTARIEHLGGDLLARTEEIVSSVARTIGQIISLIAADLIAAADRVVSRLPPAWLRALDNLAPPVPVSILLAQYRFGPIALAYDATWQVNSGASSEPGVSSSPQMASLLAPPSTLATGHQAQSVSVSQVTISVFADTGPDKPLGNALVAVSQPLSGVIGNSITAAENASNSSLLPFSSGSLSINSQSALSRLIPTLRISAAFSMSASPGRPHRETATLFRKELKDPEESDSDGESASPEGALPEALPRVLPDIGLPEENDSPLPGTDITSTVRREERQLLRQLGYQVTRMMICLSEGQPGALRWELIVQANGEPDTCPMFQIFITALFQSCAQAVVGIDSLLPAFCKFDLVLGSLMAVLPVFVKTIALGLDDRMDPKTQFHLQTKFTWTLTPMSIF